MRVSSNAVRLAALVLAATAAGYLWRAALEPSARAPTIIRLAPASRPEVPAQQVRQAPAGHRVAPKRARPRATTLRHRPTVRSVANRAAAPASRPSRPVPAPSNPKPKPAPQPPPAPAPAPQPPVATPPASSQE